MQMGCGREKTNIDSRISEAAKTHARYGNEIGNRSSRARSFTSTRKGCCAGSGERRKEGSGERVFEDLVFGVPLHAYDKSGAGQGDRLDLPIRRHCFDAQTRSWTIDTLRMQRIDHDFFRSSKRCQKPACGQHNAMRRTVRPAGRIPSGAVIEPARYFMNPLVQSTTERDIQLLDAPANCEDRKISPNRLSNQWQRRRVALPIV